MSSALAAGALVKTNFARARESALDASSAFESAGHWARLIRKKDVSATEAVRFFINRIERFDGRLNAVVVRDFDRALLAAAEADRAKSPRRALGPLHGVPMTIKEAYDVAGLATTWGAPQFAANIAAEDSAVARKLKAASAIILGKTNVPFMLGDGQTYNEIYGTTNNPWNVERTPSGSSGGAAAAIAAGMSALEVGSDIGGSIREPAHACGIYGHKSTWGVVSTRGHGPPGSLAIDDMSVSGPLARSADDLELALDVLAGPDVLDASGWRLDLPFPRMRSLKEMRVAVWPTDPLAAPSAEIVERVHAVAETLARAGAQVSDTARPDFSPRDLHDTYLSLLGALTGAGVPDAIYRQDQTLAESLAGDGSVDAVRARAQVLTHRDWLRFHTARTAFRFAWARFFSEWDILLAPIGTTTAIPHDHRPPAIRTSTVDGETRPYSEHLFWSGLATTAFLPSTVFPTGLANDGLPIGLQAIGAEYADRTTIQFARLMADEIGGFAPPPGYT